jgi:hypothetical protein
VAEIGSHMPSHAGTDRDVFSASRCSSCRHSRDRTRLADLWSARSHRVIRVESRTGARSPEAAPSSSSGAGGGHELRGVAPAVATIEVGRRRTPADEHNVHIPPAPTHVTKQPAIAIDFVQSRVRLEEHAAARRREAEKRCPRCPRVALARAELRSVDLHEADATAVPERQCVSVVDGCDHA